MNKEQIKDLLAKYRANACTDAELAILESWYLQFEHREVPNLTDQEKSDDLDKIWENMPVAKRQNPRRIRWSYLSVAAILLVTLSVGLFFSKNSHIQSNAANKKLNDIAPGGNKAQLTLDNGERISLTDAANGTIMQPLNGVTIIKESDEKLIYRVSEQGIESAKSIRYNTLTTPNGGQYQVDLPDGTKVWLNAASSIKFPTSFSKQEFRKVELIGEAYFEVSRNKRQPFKVITNKQEVEVLGTHFNISAYADELATRTTLLEGLVKVNGHFLKPGQQSIVTSDRISISNTDVEAAVAWKNGLFLFDQESLESIMRKISKWYGVDVKYTDDELKKVVFAGTISKFDHVSKVLRMLELTGDVHFKIEEKQIIVIP